jgi:hypothetical protein
VGGTSQSPAVSLDVDSCSYGVALGAIRAATGCDKNNIF